MSKIIMEMIECMGENGSVLFPKYKRNAEGQSMILQGTWGWTNPQPIYKTVGFGFGFHSVNTCVNCRNSMMDGHNHVCGCDLNPKLPANDHTTCDAWGEVE